MLADLLPSHVVVKQTSKLNVNIRLPDTNSFRNDLYSTRTRKSKSFRIERDSERQTLFDSGTPYPWPRFIFQHSLSCCDLEVCPLRTASLSSLSSLASGVSHRPLVSFR